MERKVKPDGALRFEVEFDSEPPRLASEAVGLPRLVRRGGASHAMDVTVFDAPDGRLLRAGVLVAHRVVDGAGDWYLAAPAWAPHLPEEHARPVGSNGEPPERFSRLVRPFVRSAALGPVATLTGERGEWALRTSEGGTAAIVRDEKVHVRRGGELIGRYREVSVFPTDLLTGQQREFLLSAAHAVGATIVDGFPSVQQRIGAPATGLTSFPKPRELRPDATLEEFVTALFAHHLGVIVRADLDRRAADMADVGELDHRLWVFGRDLRGLAPVLEPAWREAVESALSGLPFETAQDLEQPTLAVIDALIAGIRAPRLGDLSQRNAAQLLFERAEQAAHILAERCRTLGDSSEDAAWQAALRAAQQLEVAAEVAAPLMPKAMAALLLELDGVLDDLRRCSPDAVPGEPELDGLSPAQAYQLGQELERSRGETARRRREFVARWPERVATTRKLLSKAQKKQAKRLTRQKRP